MRSVICLQMAMARFTGGRINSVNCLYSVSTVMQAQTHTAEPPVPQPSSSEVKIAIKKLKFQALSKALQN
jgi:hypothetical protein